MAQHKDELLVKCDTGDAFTLVGRPCELSSFSFVPTKQQEPKERTYFNADKKERYSSSTYDRLYHVDYGFNNKLHRCDREHAKSRGLTVNDEERIQNSPTLSSSVYGQRVGNPLDPQGRKQYEELDPPDRQHVRIAHVQAEFFRRNQIVGLDIEHAQ